MKLLHPRSLEDALNDALRHVQVRGAVYCRSELRAPWAFGVERRPSAGFHAMLEGRGWLEVDGEDGRIELSPGDLVVLPHGHGHVMRDSPGTPPTSLAELIARHPLEDGIRLKMGGGRGAATVVICGGFELEEHGTNPLLANLPDVIHIRGKNGRPVSWLRATLRQIDAETRSGLAGGQTLIARLSDVLFLQAVRACFAEQVQDGRGRGWLRALRDPHIGKAIALIHRRPEADWDVASLAAKVGMSRSSFSARFRALVGEPPLKYVARWRVHEAARLLRTSNAKLTEIAERVGYESDVALSRLFKRLAGIAPGSYRRRHGPQK
jgi:AraC-like DNA-binding protein